MFWLIPAFLSALFIALRAFSSKKILADSDEYLVGFGSRLIACLIMLPLLFFIPTPQLGPNFWLVLITSGLLLTATTIFYMKAIKSSDVSLVMPMTSFTPVFILIISPFIIKEIPNIWGVAGILFTVFGSYILNINQRSFGYLAPFKKLLTEKGTLLMLTVALIWAFNSILDRIGTQNSSSWFWLFSTTLIISVFLLPVILIRDRKILKQLPKKFFKLLPISVASILETACYLITIQYTLIAYAVSAKRLSIIIGVLIGYFILKEKDLKNRLIGALLMISGVILIALFN